MARTTPPAELAKRPVYALDPMERRLLLSAVTTPIIVEHHGVVEALGDTAVANTITAVVTGSSTSAMLVVTVKPAGKATVSKSFALSASGGAPLVKGVILEGGAMNDTITFNNNNNFIPANPVTLMGHAGDDKITATASPGEADLILGGAGNDTISGGGGADTIFGGSGNDTITDGGRPGQVVVDGGTGNDNITINAGGVVYATDGADTVHASTLLQAVTFFGSGQDKLFGDQGDDTFYVARGGKDVVTGGGGTDQTITATSRTLHAQRTAFVTSLSLSARLLAEV